MHNAEKMAAMNALWSYLDSILSKGELDRSEAYLGTLLDAIESFVAHENDQEDNALKFFFDTQANLIPRFLQHLQKSLGLISTGSISNYNDYLLIYEIGRIFTVVFTAAIDYRKDNVERYGLLKASPVHEPWTASSTTLNCLQVQFEVMENVLRLFDPTRPNLSDPPESVEQIVYDPYRLKAVMITVLCDISDFLLGGFDIARGYYTSSSKERELEHFWERFNVVNPKISKALVDLGRPDEAFRLAETYFDYRTLVQLTLVDQNRDQRIQTYIKHYGYDFAKVLYTAYVESGDYKTLLDQPDFYNHHVDQFLSENSLDWASWPQHIRMRRLGDASKTLWKVAESEKVLQKQLTALSIAKLAFIQDKVTRTGDLDSESLSTFEKAHEFIQFQKTYHEKIIEKFKHSETHTTLQNVMTHYFTKLSQERPAFYLLAENIQTEILKGNKVSPTDLIDVLSVHDHIDEDSIMFYTSAWEILERYLGDQQVYFNNVEHQCSRNTILPTLYLEKNLAA